MPELRQTGRRWRPLRGRAETGREKKKNGRRRVREPDRGSVIHTRALPEANGNTRGCSTCAQGFCVRLITTKRLEIGEEVSATRCHHDYTHYTLVNTSTTRAGSGGRQVDVGTARQVVREHGWVHTRCINTAGPAADHSFTCLPDLTNRRSL